MTQSNIIKFCQSAAHQNRGVVTDGRYAIVEKLAEEEFLLFYDDGDQIHVTPREPVPFKNIMIAKA